MKALVIGATGAVGKDLVNRLLGDVSFSELVVFVRKKMELSHPKLTQHIINFDNVSEWKNRVTGDVLFSALGTTLKAAGSKEAQWKIDFDYQYQFAKIAKENGVNQLVLVSAMGANPNSMMFYTKMKGQLEEKIKELNFNSLSILRPPVLVRKNSDRGMEKFSVKAIQFFNKLGMFQSQKPMPTEVLATVMIHLAQPPIEGTKIFSPEEIWKKL